MREDNLFNILDNLTNIKKSNQQLNLEIEAINKEVEWHIKVCDRTQEILDDATTEFNDLTSILNKKDIPFFIFSVLLQCGIKFLIKKLRDMSDDELAEKTPFHNDEHSNRTGAKYYVSREEIISNPVPFDTFQKAHNNLWYKDNNKEIPGFNGFNHRTVALGHDPLLGLIVGTANIMTSTITRNDFISWHVNTQVHMRSRNDKEHYVNLDTICDRASTIEIFRHIASRLKKEGEEGWITLGCALLKEIVHLFSDLPSKQSLPIPVISAFSPDLARKLSLYGLNTGTIVQGGFAIMLVNWLIGFLHGLCKGENEDEQLYMVRTRKIIMYSDMFSTCSDLGYSLFLAYMGDKNTMRKFDLGGYLVTLYQISHSSNVISAVEREFYTKKIVCEFKKNANYG